MVAWCLKRSGTSQQSWLPFTAPPLWPTVRTRMTGERLRQVELGSYAHTQRHVGSACVAACTGLVLRHSLLQHTRCGQLAGAEGGFLSPTPIFHFPLTGCPCGLPLAMPRAPNGASSHSDVSFGIVG
jgi:hypothetical protein